MHARSRNVPKGLPDEISGRLVSPAIRFARNSGDACNQTTRACCFNNVRFFFESTTPPPVAMTASRAMTSRNASVSIVRNADSPRWAKISGILRPDRATIVSSRSIKGSVRCVARRLPMLLFPEPISPIKMRLNLFFAVPMITEKGYESCGSGVIPKIRH